MAGAAYFLEQMKSSSSSQNFLWLSLILIFPLGAVFWQPIPPNDYWWYLRLGNEISQTWSVPVIETFSYTQAGQPMIYHSWLSALFFFGIDKLGGVNLTLIVAALTVAGTYAILWKITREMGVDVRLASLLIVAAEIAGSINWAVRPQLFAYPLFALSLLLLYRWAVKEKAHLWLLPLIALLWVNLHGSFVLLFLLGGAAFIFGKGDRKKLFLALVAVFVVTLLNPRGFGVWDYILNSLTTVSNQGFSREWMPPVNEGPQMNLFFAWYLLFMLLVATSKRKLSLVEWAWTLGFGWLGFTGLRYGIWFLFVIAPLSALLLSGFDLGFLDQKESKEKPAFNVTVATLFLLLPFGVMPGIRQFWLPDAPSTLSTDTPVKAVAWLHEHPELPDPIWADLAFESYLVYALPERPVWVDTRFEVYPPRHWENFGIVNGARWNWEEVLLEDNINVLMLSQKTQTNLISAVETSPNWDEVYADDDSKIFLRTP